MGPVHVDALRLQALQAVPDGLVDGLPAETFHGARKAVGAGRLRTDLGADFHLVAHAAISEPLADDGLALAPEAGLGSPEGVAVRGVDPLATQIQVGVENFTGLGGGQAGSEVHGAQRHAGVCVSHRFPLLRVIRVRDARCASDRNRICTHQQELQRRHEYASPLKKMLFCGRRPVPAASALRARRGVLLLKDARGARAALLVAITRAGARLLVAARAGAAGGVAVGGGSAGSTGAPSRTALAVLATGASLAARAAAGHLPTGPALATRSSPTRTSLAPSGHALTVAGSLLLGLTVLGAGAEELVGPPTRPRRSPPAAPPRQRPRRRDVGTRAHAPWSGPSWPPRMWRALRQWSQRSEHPGTPTPRPAWCRRCCWQPSEPPRNPWRSPG